MTKGKIDLLIEKENSIIRCLREEENNSLVTKDIFNNDEFDEVLRECYNNRDDDVKAGILADEDLEDKFVSEEHKEKTEQFLKENGHNNDINEVIPPENFSHVVGQIYRSSFPRIENFQFLKERLKLKSILVLIPEEYPVENITFMQDSGIELYQVGMSGNKEPFVNLPSDMLTKALEIVLNPANQPILIHCNRGKHRTGCLIGCIRKLQNWSLTMIFDEYRRFAFPKARALDQQFIEMYDDEEIKKIAQENNWLPLQW